MFILTPRARTCVAATSRRQTRRPYSVSASARSERLAGGTVFVLSGSGGSDCDGGGAGLSIMKMAFHYRGNERPLGSELSREAGNFNLWEKRGLMECRCTMCRC